MSTTVRAIVAGRSTVHWVAPDATVFDALKRMAAENIGAVLVMTGGELIGIFSERDYARKVILHNKSSKETPVREVMSHPVYCVEPEQTAEQCMAIMTDKRVRHLPVVEFGRVVGIVSIGDVVRAVVSDDRQTISHLLTYIVSGS
jgi:CBS domain-containing protein